MKQCAWIVEESEEYHIQIQPSAQLVEELEKPKNYGRHKE